MYLHGYEQSQQLDGFFSSLFRSVKKVVKPVAHIGAAVFTGGASIPMSVNMLAQEKARKAAQQMADDQAKRDMALIVAREKAAKVSQAKLTKARAAKLPSWVVPAAVAGAAVVATAVIVSTASRR